VRARRLPLKRRRGGFVIPSSPEAAPADRGSQAAGAIRQNIQAVAKLEDEFLRNRTRADRIADAVGVFAGSLKFLVLHIAGYGFWIVVNLGWIPGLHRFDPFPFMLLSLVVSLEAIFLSTFVLMKQNRMSRREDLRAHLDLQINLLSEREMTLVLQMLQRISTRLGARLSTKELDELSEDTSVEELANELKEILPED
jgi:uncharacterized membrane protein